MYAASQAVPWAAAARWHGYAAREGLVPLRTRNQIRLAKPNRKGP